MKQVKSKIEIEWKMKHWTIVSGLLLPTFDKGTIVSEKPKSQASH